VKKPEDLSYEEARDALVEIVATLEAGSATLEESLELWERGEALAARCQDLLHGARERIENTRNAQSPTHKGQDYASGNTSSGDTP